MEDITKVNRSHKSKKDRTRALRKDEQFLSSIWPQTYPICTNGTRINVGVIYVKENRMGSPDVTVQRFR